MKAPIFFETKRKQKFLSIENSLTKHLDQTVHFPPAAGSKPVTGKSNNRQAAFHLLT